MLRARVRGTFRLSSVSLTIIHNLGAIPDFYHITNMSAAGLGRAWVDPARVLTNLMTIINSQGSVQTVDVFAINYQGRLY